MTDAQDANKKKPENFQPPKDQPTGTDKESSAYWTGKTSSPPAAEQTVTQTVQADGSKWPPDLTITNDSAVPYVGLVDKTTQDLSEEQVTAYAKHILEATNRKTLFGLGKPDPDYKEIENTVAALKQDDRDAIEWKMGQLIGDKSFRQDLQQKSKDHPAEYARVISILNRGDESDGDYQGHLKPALAQLNESGQKLDERLGANNALVDTALTVLPLLKSGKQLLDNYQNFEDLMHLKDADQDIMRTLWRMNSQDIAQANQAGLIDQIKGNKHLSEGSKDALNILLLGRDNWASNDADIAKLAQIGLQSHRLDLFQSAMESSDTVRKQFNTVGGFVQIDRAFPDETERQSAKDYAQWGHNSLVSDLHGYVHPWHTNKEAITRRLSTLSQEERDYYTKGKELAQDFLPKTPEEQDARRYYMHVRESLINAAGGNNTEFKAWEAQLFGKQFHASVLDAFDENKENPIDFTTSILTQSHPKKANIIMAIANMSKEEQDLYRDSTNSAFRDKLNARIASDLDSPTQKQLANSLLEKIAEGKPAQLSSTEQVLLDNIGGTSGLEAIQHLEKAFKDNPGDKNTQSLQSRLSHPITEEDKKLREEFQTAILRISDTAATTSLIASGLGEARMQGRIPKYMFDTGHVPMQLKLAVNPDTKLHVDDILSAPEDVKQRLLDNTASDERTKWLQDKVLGTGQQREFLQSVLAKRDISELTPVEKARAFALGVGGTSGEMRAMLLDMDVDTKRQMSQDYFNQYHSLMNVDLTKQAKGNDATRFQNALKQTNVSLTDQSLDATAEYYKHRSLADSTIDSFWDRSHMDAQEYNKRIDAFLLKNGQNLTEDQKQLFVKTMNNYYEAQENCQTSKSEFAKTFADTTRTTAAVVGSLFAPEVTIPLLAATGVGGSLYELGVHRIAQGDDFSTDPDSLKRHAFEGATAAMLGVAGPKQLGLGKELFALQPGIKHTVGQIIAHETEQAARSMYTGATASVLTAAGSGALGMRHVSAQDYINEAGAGAGGALAFHGVFKGVGVGAQKLSRVLGKGEGKTDGQASVHGEVMHKPPTTEPTPVETHDRIPAWYKNTLSDGTKIVFDENKGLTGAIKVEHPSGSIPKDSALDVIASKTRDTDLGPALDPLAKNILLSPSADAILKEIPDGCIPIGHGKDSIALLAPDKSTVYSIREGDANRPLDCPMMLKPLKKPSIHGGYVVEQLPYVDTKNITPADVGKAQEQLNKLGWKFTDDHVHNIGRLPDGKLVVLDPEAVQRISDNNLAPTVSLLPIDNEHPATTPAGKEKLTKTGKGVLLDSMEVAPDAEGTATLKKPSEATKQAITEVPYAKDREPFREAAGQVKDAKLPVFKDTPQGIAPPGLVDHVMTGISSQSTDQLIKMRQQFDKVHSASLHPTDRALFEDLISRTKAEETQRLFAYAQKYPALEEHELNLAATKNLPALIRHRTFMEGVAERNQNSEFYPKYQQNLALINDLEVEHVNHYLKNQMNKRIVRDDSPANDDDIRRICNLPLRDIRDSLSKALGREAPSSLDTELASTIKSHLDKSPNIPAAKGEPVAITETLTSIPCKNGEILVTTNSTGSVSRVTINDHVAKTSRTIDDRGRLVETVTEEGNLRQFILDGQTNVKYIYGRNGESTFSSRTEGGVLKTTTIRPSGETEISTIKNGSLEALPDGSVKWRIDNETTIRHLDGSEELHRPGRRTIYRPNPEVERQRINQNIEDAFKDEPNRTVAFKRTDRLRAFFNEFEKQADEKKFSLSEKAAFYKQLNRLLSDNSDCEIASAADRRDLAEQILKCATETKFIDQGLTNKTCNVTTVEKRLWARHPAATAQLVADCAIDGRFVTSSGKVVELKHIQNGLKPDPESSLSLSMQRLGGPQMVIDAERSWASQIAQMTLANAAWKHKSIYLTPDGVVDPINIVFDHQSSLLGQLDPENLQPLFDSHNQSLLSYDPTMTIKDKNGNTLDNVQADELVYDSRGDLIGRVPPEARNKISPLYDKAGNQINKLDPGEIAYDKPSDGQEVFRRTNKGDVSYQKVDTLKSLLDLSNDIHKPKARLIVQQNAKAYHLSDRSGTYFDSTKVFNTEYHELAREISGEKNEPPFLVMREKVGKTFTNMVDVSSEKELEDLFTNWEKDNNYPGIVGVYVNHPPFNRAFSSSDASSLSQSGHAINIWGYSRDENGTMICDCTCNWGKKWHLKIPASELFEAMRKPNQ